MILSAPWLRIVRRYGLAFLLVTLALLVRQGLESQFGPMPPFIVFYPAILVSAVFAGRGPGILATLLSVLTAAWYFSPQGQFVRAPINQIALVIFGVTNIFLSVLLERLRRMRWIEAVSYTRQQELEKLTRSELLLKSSLESQKDTILLSIDRNFRYLYFNKAHLEVMKQVYKVDIAVGMDLLSCITLDQDRIAARQNYSRALRGESHTNVQLYGLGAPEYFESFFNPILDDQNQVVGATALARNITTRLRDQEALRDSDERLVELNQKLYALNEHSQTVQERERIAIARDIHDDIGQNITVLKLDVEWILHRIPDPDTDMFERLHEMRLSVDQLTSKVQRIAADLRPPLLDQVGLIAAIEWQVAEFGKRSGLECFMMLNEAIDPLDPHLATTVMRIIQEALTNVARHSKATEVSVSLCKRDGNMLLEISDNGCGITAEQLTAPKAYGMIGMQERARSCRGELEIAGEPGRGTTLHLTVPLATGGIAA